FAAWRRSAAHEGGEVASEGQRGSNRARSGNGGNQRRRSPRDEEGLIPVLAGVAREVDNAVRRPPTRPSVRAKFQVVALLVREEKARVKADAELSEAKRNQELKRLDGVATQLAKIAARDTSLLGLLADDAKVSEAARALKATVLRAAGMEVPDEPEPEAPPPPPPGAEKRVVPRSVISRQLANPFLAPDFDAVAERLAARPRRLAGWELLEPLFRAFEVATPGAVSCMELPEPRPVP